ncbi:hypothetical protein CLOM_g8089 [Closterium sp. NIES-68]|nr:hypothetical protein CLOM_g8089 [Closterium sp. NIES-68]
MRTKAIWFEVGVKIRRVRPSGKRHDAIAVGSTAVGDEIQHEDARLQESATDEKTALPVVKAKFVGVRVAFQVLVVGDGDDDIAVEASLSLHEAPGRTHVLTAAAIQEPGVSPGGFGVGDCSVPQENCVRQQ